MLEPAAIRTALGLRRTCSFGYVAIIMPTRFPPLGSTSSLSDFLGVVGGPVARFERVGFGFGIGGTNSLVGLG